jgi:hypothetical protein
MVWKIVLGTYSKMFCGLDRLGKCSWHLFKNVLSSRQSGKMFLALVQKCLVQNVLLSRLFGKMFWQLIQNVLMSRQPGKMFGSKCFLV